MITDMKGTSRIRRIALIAAIVLALDEATKTIARTLLEACTAGPASACDQVALPGPMQLLRLENSGSALGFSQGAALWPVLAAAGIGLVLLLGAGGRPGRPMTWSVGLMLGGAIGNLMDRFLFGGVTDFLGFTWGGHGGVSINLADLALAVGTMIATAVLYRGFSARASAVAG